MSGASRLAGKVVLITGASSGIGQSTAIEFAKACPTVKLILTARREARLKELKAEIESKYKGVKVFPLKLDVGDAKEVRTFISKLPVEFQKIDICVNNAGLAKGMEVVGEISEEDVYDMININVLGLINVTQAVMKVFKANGGHGDFVQVGSIAGYDGYPKGSVYCASKAAIRTFTQSLQKETIDTRIRAIIVDPGQVETEFSVVRFSGDKAKADAVYAGCEPLTPEDIAEIILFTVTRRENVVIANTLVFPSHQASATAVYKKSS